MLEIKLFEVRDRMTLIPVLAVRLSSESEAERYLLARSGYGEAAWEQADYVLMVDLNGGHGYSTCDPFEWEQERHNRTLRIAHEAALHRWKDLRSGDVIDVEFEMGTKAAPAEPQRLTSAGERETRQ